LLKNLAQGSDQRTNRLHRIEVGASNLLVTAVTLDLPEASSLQNAPHRIGVAKANGPGATGSRAGCGGK